MNCPICEHEIIDGVCGCCETPDLETLVNTTSNDLAFFTHYLPIGKHGHVTLKRAYFNAARDYVATEWKASMYRLCESGNIIMTEAESHGETVDFFMAVVMARHDAKPVKGYIEVYNGG
jgi:hypothetical protein